MDPADRVLKAQELATKAQTALRANDHPAGCQCNLCSAARLTLQAVDLLVVELFEEANTDDATTGD